MQCRSLNHSTSRVRKVLVSLVLTAGLLGVGSSPPVAAHGWTDPDSWAGSHTIGVGYSVSSGNIVKLWQRAMAIRYYGSPVADGYFGTTTKNYTLFWQAEHQPFTGIAVDGVVGPQTWNAARFFHVGAPTWTSASWHKYAYEDGGGYFVLAYARPFATWFLTRCVTRYNGYIGEIYAIDHPIPSPGAQLGAGCD